MFCIKCGKAVPEGAEFCGSCGASLAAQAETGTKHLCSACGAELLPGSSFCNKCGARIGEQQAKQPVTSSASASTSGPTASSVKPVAKESSPSVLPAVLVAGIGAALMLVSLAFPWYASRVGGLSADIKVSDLLSRDSVLDWKGSGLPIVVVIAVAGLVILSLLIAVFRNKATKGLWSSLGSLGMIAVLANAGYILWWHYDNTRPHQWINIVNTGSVLAFAGAVIIMIGAGIAPEARKS